MEATHNPQVMTGLVASRDSDGSVTLIADGPDGPTVMRLSSEMAAGLAMWEQSGSRVLAFGRGTVATPDPPWVHTTWPYPHGSGGVMPCTCP